MKHIVKKNQLIITALAIMIAVAGYLNYAGNRLEPVDFETVTDGEELALEISSEDQYAMTGMEELTMEGFTYDEGDILSLDSDEEGMDMTAQITEGETPGEAILTSTEAMVDNGAVIGFSYEAKITREQLRARNKELLMEVINNSNISEVQKQEAIDSMIAMTDIAEREVAAETLLLAKGFEDVVVSITDDMVDVVVNLAQVDDAGRAQIEDIVKRKTGLPGENIVITPMAPQSD